MRILGDSAYDTLDWYDHLPSVVVMYVAPFKPRNTDDSKDIEYRFEYRIKEYSEDVQLKQLMLDKTYNR